MDVENLKFSNIKIAKKALEIGSKKYVNEPKKKQLLEKKHQKIIAKKSISNT